MIKVDKETRYGLHFMGLIDKQVYCIWTFEDQPIYYETMDHELIRIKPELEDEDNDQSI